MADWTLTIPDPIEARLLDAIAAKHRYDPASGLTKRQFARRVVMGWLRDQLEVYEGGIAAADADAAARAAIRAELPDA